MELLDDSMSFSSAVGELSSSSHGLSNDKIVAKEQKSVPITGDTITSTSHIKTLTKLNCTNQYCNEVVICTLDQQAIKNLQSIDVMWEITTMVSVSTTIYHFFHLENECNTAVFVQSESALELKPFNPTNKIRRLIVIVLHAQHYIILDIDYDAQSVRSYDGFQDQFALTTYNKLRPFMKRFIDQYVPCEGREEWLFSVDNYMKQDNSDGTSCGPIALFTLSYLLNKKSFNDEKIHSTFTKPMRQYLIDWYLDKFEELKSKDLLYRECRQLERQRFAKRYATMSKEERKRNEDKTIPVDDYSIDSVVYKKNMDDTTKHDQQKESFFELDSSDELSTTDMELDTSILQSVRFLYYCIL
jgi:hypothetical protein